MAVVMVTNGNFDEIKNSEKPVLLDFYADWCGPCKMVSPLVDQIGDEHTEFLVGKVNVDDNMEVAEKYQIMSIPTILVVKNGSVTKQFVGVTSKSEIEEAIK